MCVCQIEKRKEELTFHGKESGHVASSCVFLPVTDSPCHAPGVCSAAEWLSQVLPSSAKVVKAFCNLSAYCLLHGDPLTEHMKSVAASDSLEAAHTVAEFGKAMGLEVR